MAVGLQSRRLPPTPPFVSHTQSFYHTLCPLALSETHGFQVARFSSRRPCDRLLLLLLFLKSFKYFEKAPFKFCQTFTFGHAKPVKVFATLFPKSVWFPKARPLVAHRSERNTLSWEQRRGAQANFRIKKSLNGENLLQVVLPTVAYGFNKRKNEPAESGSPHTVTGGFYSISICYGVFLLRIWFHIATNSFLVTYLRSAWCSPIWWF